MGEFQFQPTTLLAVLTSGFFKVPIYQRSYSWDINQIEDFWNDITRAILDGGEYFLGTLVFSTSDNDGLTSVIDGQQRLATTTLLLAALRDKWLEQGKAKIAQTYSDVIAPTDLEDYEDKPRIRLNTKDHPYYDQLILKSESPTSETDSHEKILSASKYFSNELANIISKRPSDWEKAFSDIYKFLNKQARVITVKAPTDADAFVIFETLNDRGADLTIADLLKNYLFSRSGTELAIVQERWQSSQSILEEYQEEREFVTFLRHLWSSSYGATRERDLYRDMKSKITSKTQAATFSKSLVDGGKSYGAILSSENDFWTGYPKQSRAYVSALNEFNLQQSRPTLLAIVQMLHQSEIEKVLKAFVSISVRGLITGGIGGGQAERYLCEAAVDIRAKKITTAKAMLAKLRPIIPSDSDFGRAFSTYATGNNKFARYILLSVEKHLQAKPEPEFVPNDDAQQVNLEHILPKSAKSAEWPAFTVDELASYPYRIGNMTLLQKGVNGKIGNRPWSIKHPKISLSDLALNKAISAESDWRVQEIEKRQISLAQKAIAVWKV